MKNKASPEGGSVCSEKHIPKGQSRGKLET